MDEDWDDPPLGIVPLAGRGSLPFALVHGESLVACASWAMGGAEVDLVDFNVDWAQVRDGGRALVLHDPLCPLTPASFIASAAALSAREDLVVVGADERGEVLSPIVLPGGVVATMTEAPDLTDFAALVARLRDRGAEIRWLVAPSYAARVADESDLPALERLSGRG